MAALITVTAVVAAALAPGHQGGEEYCRPSSDGDQAGSGCSTTTPGRRREIVPPKRGHNFETCSEILAGPSHTSSATFLRSLQSLAILGRNLFSLPPALATYVYSLKPAWREPGRGFFVVVGGF